MIKQNAGKRKNAAKDLRAAGLEEKMSCLEEWPVVAKESQVVVAMVELGDEEEVAGWVMVREEAEVMWVVVELLLEGEGVVAGGGGAERAQGHQVGKRFQDMWMSRFLMG